MAGTIPLSLTQQLDQNGNPLVGGKIYFIQAGTTSTPQNAYQDSGLTITWPNPITLDSRGFIPQLFFADGSIKVRLTDASGVEIFVADNILVIGPSAGGGGGSTVDATTILATGDIKTRYSTGTLNGFVRANGRTIGSATSGATERANLDCQALFQFLWSVDGNLVVSGGRGASAAADWSANKTIALPDFAGRVLAGLDDMGAGPQGRLTAAGFGPNATTLGAPGGAESHTLTTPEIPAHNHGVTDPGHTHTINNVPRSTSTSFIGNNNQVYIGSNNSGVSSWTSDDAFTGITINNTGGGTAHANVQPTILITIYIKL